MEKIALVQFEQFINDAEIKFKVDSRRNKYIGEWVADQLGKNEKEKKGIKR